MLSCTLVVQLTLGLDVPVCKLVRVRVPTPLDDLVAIGKDRVTVPLIERVICVDGDDTKSGLADVLKESYITDCEGDEESLAEGVSTPGVACN